MGAEQDALSGDWALHARCRYEGHPDMFYPVGTKVTLRRNSLPARLICERCPVKRECLEEALALPPYRDYGVWGGTTHEDRDRMRRARGQKLPEFLRG